MAVADSLPVVDGYLDNTILTVLKHTVGFLDLVKRIPVRDMGNGAYPAFLDETEYLLTVTAVHSAGLVLTAADGNTVDRYINCLSLTIYTNDEPKDDGNGFHYVCDCEASHLSDLKIIKDGVPFINTSFVEVESDNVVLTRTFTPDEPSTFMLPFSVSIAEVLGVALYEFQGDVTYNDETNEWETYVIDMTSHISQYPIQNHVRSAAKIT